MASASERAWAWALLRRGNVGAFAGHGRVIEMMVGQPYPIAIAHEEAVVVLLVEPGRG